MNEKTFKRCRHAILAAVGLTVILWGGGSVRACGPDFPNTLLDGGDAAVLAAPTADFRRELQRLRLAAPEFLAVVTTNSYAEDTLSAELDDLSQALQAAGMADLDRARIVARQGIARDQLQKYVKHLEAVQIQKAAGDLVGKADSEPPANANAPASVSADQIAFSAGDASTAEVAADAAAKINPPAPAAGLPAEFARYFAGSVAWGRSLTNAARSEWEAVLRLPAAQRHYRSTWAAYMLGRSWAEEDPERAVDYYQQVRQLARSGFVDHLGLAAASLGWEAQVRLQQKRYEEATTLYLAQLAAGDNSAVISLQVTAARMLQLPPNALPSLAADPQTRRVITAYIISHPRYLQCGFTPEGDPKTDNTPSPNAALDLVRNWANAVATARVKDMECSEELALAAYQTGDWSLAQRWINHAPTTPTLEWLQVKLWLRAGDTNRAAQLLDEVVRRFPLAPDDASIRAPTDLKDTLSMGGATYRDDNTVDAASEVRGELGVLRLARGDYAEALDTLLRGGFWLDAAYVAERVMTVDELKNYVEFNWPAPDPAGTPPAAAQSFSLGLLDGNAFNPARELRYLLARRLARRQRMDEARAYYPPEWLGSVDRWQALLKLGTMATRPAAERAEALYACAWMERTNGMELTGTEDEPDWHIFNGCLEGNLTVALRTSLAASNLVHASDEELARAAANRALPEVRYHYRDLAALQALSAAKLSTNDFYEMSEIITHARGWLRSDEVTAEFYRQAAALGWQATRALPDDTEETARELCIAGSWIKDYDPKAADFFYKALVRRCRHTDIGEQADRKRWFPKLDAQGNLLPWIPNPPSEVPPPQAAFTDTIDVTNQTTPAQPPGYIYVLHRGDSLQDVVAVVHRDHQLDITVDDLLAANSQLHPDKLKPGQQVFVPMP